MKFGYIMSGSSHNVNYAFNASFGTATWQEIKTITQRGMADNLWSVGDTRTEDVSVVKFTYSNTNESSSSSKKDTLRIVGINQDGNNTITVASSSCLMKGPFDTGRVLSTLGSRAEYARTKIFSNDANNVMKTVNKSGLGDCKLFVPSITELNVQNISGDGKPYSYYTSASTRNFGEIAATRTVRDNDNYYDGFVYGVSTSGSFTRISIDYSDTGFSVDLSFPVMFVVG